MELDQTHPLTPTIAYTAKYKLVCYKGGFNFRFLI